MTSYRTDKTSRVILAIFVAYAVGYGVVRTRSLRLVTASESNGGRPFTQPVDTSSDNGWASIIFGLLSS